MFLILLSSKQLSYMAVKIVVLLNLLLSIAMPFCTL